MKLWKWQRGRQHGCNYVKFPLWYFKIGKWGFDAYILKYYPNTELKWHTDPVPNGKHWRKNFTIKGYASFLIRRNNNVESYFFSDCSMFRPDIHEHMLKVYENGCVKLSFGFVKYNN